jgi:hypothetical protein
MAIEKTRPAAPPRKSTVTTTKPSVGDAKHRKRKEGLQSVQQATGLALMALKQPADAAALGEHGEPIIDELVKLGDTDDQIGKALDYLTKTGPYSALVMACLPLAMQIAVNHGRMKPNALMPGVVSRETLEARAKAGMAQAQAEALDEQRKAEDAYREVQDRLARQQGFQNEPEKDPVAANGYFGHGPE